MPNKSKVCIIIIVNIIFISAVRTHSSNIIISKNQREILRISGELIDKLRTREEKGPIKFV